MSRVDLTKSGKPFKAQGPSRCQTDMKLARDFLALRKWTAVLGRKWVASHSWGPETHGHKKTHAANSQWAWKRMPRLGWESSPDWHHDLSLWAPEQRPNKHVPESWPLGTRRWYIYVALHHYIVLICYTAIRNESTDPLHLLMDVPVAHYLRLL